MNASSENASYKNPKLESENVAVNASIISRLRIAGLFHTLELLGDLPLEVHEIALAMWRKCVLSTYLEIVANIIRLRRRHWWLRNTV